MRFGAFARTSRCSSKSCASTKGWLRVLGALCGERLFDAVDHCSRVMAQHHRDAAVARQPGGNPDLQIVVGHDERAVLERQAGPHGADLRRAEASRQLGADRAQARAALADRRRRGPCRGIAVAAVPGRSEYGNTWRCDSGDAGR